MPSELKPCPFCGSNKVRLADVMDFHFVKCDFCGNEGLKDDAVEEAVEAWNRRALPQEPSSASMGVVERQRLVHGILAQRFDIGDFGDDGGVSAVIVAALSSSSFVLVQVAAAGDYEQRVRSCFTAAPSPSPAPGVVEALRKARQLVDIATDWNLDEVEIDGEMVRTYSLGAEFDAALASLSQPAKGEREGGE